MIQPEILVAVGSAIAVLGIQMWRNRSEIKTLKVWIFGHESENGGKAEQIESITSKLDRLEEKIDEESEQRRQDHFDVETEVRENRRVFHLKIDNLVEEIDRELDDLDISDSDIEPDELYYYSDFEGGNRPSHLNDEESEE